MIALIQKFIDNSISDKELLQLKKWLQDSKNRTLFDDYIKDAHDLDILFSKVDVKASYDTVLLAIKEKESTGKPWSVVYKYAAVLFIFIGLTFGAYKSKLFESSIDQTENPSEVTLEMEDGTIQPLDGKRQIIFTSGGTAGKIKQEYTKLVYDKNEETGGSLVYNKLMVPYGKRFEVLLSDGTSVFLNSGSVLRYPVAFNDSVSRKVFLEGEGFFSVAENKNKPFLVETNEVVVEVLGTKFNVSSYTNDDDNSIVLKEGKVLVDSNSENRTEPLLMLPGQQVLENNGQLIVKEVNVQEYIAWVDGSLVFANDRFENIAKELERYYDVKIINKDKDLNDVRYTGTFKNEPLERVLAIFKETTDFEFKIDRRIVTIN